MFDSLFRIAVMLIFSLILRESAHEKGLYAFSLPGFLRFLAVYPIFVFFGMSVGIFLAPFNVLFNDVGRLVKTVLTPLRFISPVFIPLPATGKVASIINVVNPLVPLLNGMRSLATSNTLPQLDRLAIWGAGYVALFLVGWFIFHVSVPILAEKA